MFPMGSFGARTMKWTTLLQLNYLDVSCVERFPTEPQLFGSHPRLWGTHPGLHSLRRPLDVKQLREALARTGAVGKKEHWKQHYLKYNIHIIHYK